MEEDRAQTDLGIAADIEASHREEEEAAAQPALKQPKKRFVGRRTAAEAAAKNGGSNGSIEDSKSIQGEIDSPPPSTSCFSSRLTRAPARPSSQSQNQDEARVS